MLSSTSNSIELQCPACRYDLHGLQTDRAGHYRCPECGGLTHLIAIIEAHQRRQRHQWRTLMAALLITAAIVLARSVPFEPDWSKFDHRWLADVLTRIVVTGSIAWLIYGLRLGPAFIVGVVTGVLITFSQGSDTAVICGTPLLVMWIVGFHWWFVNRDLY